MSLKRLAFALLLAVVLAVFIRTFVFETIRVATPAMSESQPLGNRLIVEKWTIGARLPLSIGIPFAPESIFGKKTYFQTLNKPYRFLGIGGIKRNDLLVFNCPVADSLPIDRHAIMLSRCVGLPGELIKLQGPRIFINDEEVQRAVDISICYRYAKSAQKNVESQLKLNQINKKTFLEKDSGFVYLTRYEYYTVSRQKNGEIIDLKTCTSSFDEQTVLIPYKGFRIELSNRSFRTWGALINRYEGVKLERTESGRFKKNGKDADFYLFKQNYYWLLNDHQGYLNDSRSLGMITEDHLIGKAWLVLFSPKTKRFLQKI